MSTTTMTRTKTTQIVAVLDVTEPARRTASHSFPLVSVREPDYCDPVEGALVWIGDEAAVEVSLTVNIAHVMRQSGWHERVGHRPCDLGIAVFRHAHDRIGTWADVRQALDVQHDYALTD